MIRSWRGPSRTLSGLIKPVANFLMSMMDLHEAAPCCFPRSPAPSGPQECWSLLLFFAFEVSTRGCMCGHDRAVLAGQLVELPATAVADAPDGVAAVVANLPAVTEKDAIAAGRVKWAGVGEMGLSWMRRSNLVREHVGEVLCKVQGARNHLGPLPLPLTGRSRIACAISIRLMFCRPTSGRFKPASTSDHVPACRSWVIQ